MSWIDRRWRFETTLTPEECAARLSPAIDGYFSLFGGKTVIGHANAGGAGLRKRIWYNNSFRSVLTARFQRNGTRTLVECRTGMSIFVIGFMVVWCGGVLLIGGGVAFSALSDPSLGAGSLGLALFPVAMIGFAAAIVAFGRWLARDEAEFLDAFLRRRLDAARP
jgi:hypothetical protein